MPEGKAESIAKHNLEIEWMLGKFLADLLGCGHIYLEIYAQMQANLFQLMPKAKFDRVISCSHIKDL